MRHNGPSMEMPVYGPMRAVGAISAPGAGGWVGRTVAGRDACYRPVTLCNMCHVCCHVPPSEVP
jgi:hypothetical protein